MTKDQLRARKDRAAWAGVCKRFPAAEDQLDHCACIMAAQAGGKINARIEVARSLGGWVSSVTGYAPFLKDYYQTFPLNTDPDYPSIFETERDATKAAVLEQAQLIKALRNQ